MVNNTIQLKLGGLITEIDLEDFSSWLAHEKTFVIYYNTNKSNNVKRIDYECSSHEEAIDIGNGITEILDIRESE